MSPEQRSVINKQNASHSTGPVTDSGKAIVSGNAVKHALSGKAFAALAGEEAAFEAHLESYRKTYLPANKPEDDMVRALAEHNWRLKRAHEMENSLYRQVCELEIAQDSAAALPNARPESEIADLCAQAYLDAAKGLQRIAIYAGRIQRAIEKTAAALQSTQSARKTAYAAAHEEAVLLVKLAAARKEAFDPATHFSAPDEAIAPTGGFVFSREAIDRELARAARIAEARAVFIQDFGASDLLKGALI